VVTPESVTLKVVPWLRKLLFTTWEMPVLWSLNQKSFAVLKWAEPG